MKLIKNEQGIALVTALLMTMIALAISMVMMYLVLQGTQLSGAHKRFTNVREATVGGVEVATLEALPLLLGRAINAPMGVLPTNYFLNALDKSKGGSLDLSSVVIGNGSAVSDTCLQAKMLTRDSQWPSACNKVADAKVSPDLQFILQSKLPNAPSGYRVYSKVVATSPGNTDMSGRLLEGDQTTSAAKNDVGAPYVYRIEVTGENAVNPKERANYSVVYAY